MRRVLLTAAAALALVACQKSQPAAPVSASASASAGPGATATSTSAPHRRAGLWEQTITKDGRKTAMGGMRICLDEASEEKAVGMADAGMAKEVKSECSQHSASRGLDGSFHFASTCAFPEGGTVTSVGEGSGDFSSTYHVKIDTTISGSKYAPANGHHVSEVDGKWLGPCPAGMSAGDVQLANGMKFNGHRIPGMPGTPGGPGGR